MVLMIPPDVYITDGRPGWYIIIIFDGGAAGIPDLRDGRVARRIGIFRSFSSRLFTV